MKLKDIKRIINGSVVCEGNCSDVEFISACGSDLMSDVMAFLKNETLLLTGLINPQVIRTAEMMDIKAVVFVRGKKPDSKMVELALEKDIILVTTEYPMFVACGKLYSAGMREEGC